MLICEGTLTFNLINLLTHCYIVTNETFTRHYSDRDEAKTLTIKTLHSAYSDIIEYALE